jgi:hypothetical protein
MLTFPDNLTPNFIDFALPEYLGSAQEFKSTDYVQAIYQDTSVGLQLIGRYEKLPLVKLTTLRNFHKQVSVESFLLPTDFLTNFDSTIKPLLTEFSFWIFKDSVKIQPYIINKTNKIYNCQITLQSVLS